MVQKIEISHKTIIFIIVFLLALWFVYSILDILILLFVAFLLGAAMRPSVEWMESRRVPRAVAILIHYVIVIGLIAFTLVSVVPSLVVQTTKFVQLLPAAVPQFLPNLRFDIATVTQQIAPIGENLLKLTFGIFSNIVTTVTVLVFSFYMMLERKRMDSHLDTFMGKQRSESLMRLLVSVEDRLGSWVQGELILMLTIGVLTHLGLSVLHVEFALPLAIIAGILEIVPTIGPIVSAVPSILVALTVSPLLAASVAALYFVVQQLENNLIVPYVMRHSVGLSPLITILALMVGGRLAGVGGAILSIPVVLVIQEVVRYFLVTRDGESREA